MKLEGKNTYILGVYCLTKSIRSNFNFIFFHKRILYGPTEFTTAAASDSQVFRLDIYDRSVS